MTVPLSVLHGLCPLHVAMDPAGRIVQAGRSVGKLDPMLKADARFLDVFEVYRPGTPQSMAELLGYAMRRLHLRLRARPEVPLKGTLAPDGAGGAVVTLSFGVSVVEAVSAFDLNAQDFAPSDPIFEIFYMLEAKSAAMEASRQLSAQLQGVAEAAEFKAFTDGLTGLRNRRALDTVLARLTSDNARFALLHLDLDYFKQVNDTYGHAAGDHVLQHLAAVLERHTRKDDTVARMGGDEFVIIVPGTPGAARLKALAEGLIDEVETPIAFEGQSCRVSLSIGISFGQGDGATAEQVMAQADTALYASKGRGRACFSFYERAMSLEKTGGERLPKGN